MPVQLSSRYEVTEVPFYGKFPGGPGPKVRKVLEWEFKAQVIKQYGL